MSKLPTMNDVAREAGVSQATVSYVINGTASISPEVKGRVNDAIEKIGYTINLNAKSLKTQRTNIVGVLIPDIDNGFYSEMIREIEHYLRRNGYIMLLCNTSYDSEIEKEYIKTLFEHNVAGIIIGYGLIEQSIYSDKRYHNKSIIVIDDLIEKKEFQIPSMEIDNIKAGKIAASHLLNTGAKKICFASEPLSSRALKNRYVGFHEEVKKCNLTESEWCAIIEDRQYKKVEMGNNIGAKIILDGEIDAVFATSDILAYGIVQKLLNHGIKIPQNIIVMGFDDIPLARFMTPRLTTISQPIKDFARLAVGALVNSIENKQNIVHEILEPLLIIRDSTLHHF